MKRVPITLLVLALVVLVGLAYPDARSGGVVGQKRASRPASTRTSTRQARIDYSKFLHTTAKHQGACSTCHKVPTSNWPKVRAYPDIVDYPGHDACVSCHRPQFFKGAKPPICSVCHSKVSPRDDVRFAFRNPAGQRQFVIEFPHNKHQDVIAKLFLKFPKDARYMTGLLRPSALEPPWFVSASFKSSRLTPDEKAKHYNNCEICHGPRNTPSVPPASAWTDGYVPDNLTLKSVPGSHAACFSCHWKSEQPINSNCVGCHKLPPPAAPISVLAAPERKSMKFRHGREQHLLECTTCHINITKAATLRGLKPDVPITACTECHNKDGLRLDLAKELVAIDKNREFVCLYCHTSNVGRLDPPASHYLIAERPPVKRKDIK